ncbi:hypothetical protein [Deinococcus sp.]|uniref:hypothetical protein n=1 Tax=Deinococcus sp. TaxID=47478 RepID=UPI0025D5626B|nr:hypothetical protein [Deinococcus sp.]
MKSTSVLLSAFLLLGTAQARLSQETIQAQVAPAQTDSQTPTTQTPTTQTPEIRNPDLLNLDVPTSDPRSPDPQLAGNSRAPQFQRTSTVSLPFEAPVEARELIVAHDLPTGASYQAGSAQLGGKAIADPLVGAQGRLYWLIPAQQSGTLSYSVSYSGVIGELAPPALLARYGAERGEVLRGTIDAADLSAAQPFKAASTLTENVGAVKLPLAGTVYRQRDRITVVVEGPLDQLLAPTINGTPLKAEQIGSRTEDPARGVQRLEYIGTPLKPGPNVIKLGNESVTVSLAGVTSRIEITPLALVADGNSLIKLRVRAYDAYGVLSSLPRLTVRTNLEPALPDAAPDESGYQLNLNDGEGLLVLRPQSAPVSLSISTLVGNREQISRFEVKPGGNRLAVGMVSATFGLPDFRVDVSNFSYQARASLETPLAGGKLYLAADKGGLPTGENVYQRTPIYGDNSAESTPLQGIDPVAFIYDHPTFRASYKQGGLPGDVLPVGGNFTALQVSTKNAGPRLSAFLAAVPGDKITARLSPEGRLLKLQRGVSPGSESLTVVTLEKSTGKELGRVALTRLSDYTLDTDSGVVTFNQALEPLNADLDDVRVDATYRLSNPLNERKLAYGVQLWQQSERYAVGAAVASVDGVSTVGARASYTDTNLRAGLLAAYSGGVQLSAEVDYRVSASSALTARARYQDTDYVGLAPASAGLSLSAGYRAKLGERLSASLDGEYHRSAATETVVATQGGSTTARVDYNFKPFSVGGGARYAFGDTFGLGAVASVGYHQQPVDVDITHVQPLSGNLDTTTDVTAKFNVAKNVTLGLRDSYTWGKGHVASLSTDTKLGNVNYAVTYELPDASGGGNRARFGADTSLPLGQNFSAGLRGAAVYGLSDGKSDYSGGADLRYQGNNLSGSVGSDLSLRDASFGAVFRAGLTGSLTPGLTLSADGTAEVGRTQGLRAAVGYAYRSGDLNSLGYARYASGSLAGAAPELTAGVHAEYHRTQYAIRGGLDARELLSDAQSLTLQPSLSGIYYIGDRFGIGAQGRALVQPATGSPVLGFGVEGSVRALPGTWLTAGYNLAGFEGIGNLYTKRGLYLRLDLTVDETLGGRK